ncbi:MAG: cytochrome b/b6 domain-containing protein [Gammaproteobacteria bacterium]|nr:cytochrome b/b6 domain-containing protein [Gammaproteobacteria bacterium]MDH5593239.1 cytochrome b/b6 domain-containing protein [Gammaproteobacteria bacterium]
MNERIYVWDPLVRIFHWSLVLTFIVCYLTGEEEGLIHAYSGYVILGLVAFRVIWGLVGTKYARFTDFIYSPVETIGFIKGMLAGKVKDYLGHNPAGGWMIVALLISLLLTGLSGVKVYGLEGYGPLAVASGGQEQSQIQETRRAYKEHEEDDDDHDKFAQRGKEHRENDDENESEEFWEEIHEFFANFTVLLIGLHVAGVLLSSIRENRNLVKSMLTGYKLKNH